MDIGDLFINKNYELQDFDYKDISIKLYCSKSSVTDHDLTGQIIWPSSIELSKFIIDNQEMFKDKTVLELGAGAGLCGIVASKYAKYVIITDGNELVTELIQQNVELHKQNGKINLIGMEFVWGTVQCEELLTKLQSLLNDQNLKIDIIIGADIIFWPQSVMGLSETIQYFCQKNLETKIFISGSKRANSTEIDLDTNILKMANKKRYHTKVIEDYAQTVYIYEVK